MSCVQKIVKFKHKKAKKHWTFMLNFLLGVYSVVFVQPVSITLCST